MFIIVDSEDWRLSLQVITSPFPHDSAFGRLQMAEGTSSLCVLEELLPQRGEWNHNRCAPAQSQGIALRMHTGPSGSR